MDKIFACQLHNMFWLEIIIGILQNKQGFNRIHWLSAIELLAMSPTRDFRELYRQCVLSFPVRRD